MKKLAAVLLILISINIYSQNRIDVEKQKNDFNYELLEKEYDSQKNSGNNLYLAELSFALSKIADYKFIFGPIGEKHAEEAIRHGLLVKEDNLDEKQKIKLYTILTEMYNRLIVDAGSWMKNSKPKKKYHDLLLKKDPNNLSGNLMKATDLMNMPESVGGDKKAGLKMLEDLLKKYPKNYVILMEMASYFIDEKEYLKAREYYVKVIAVNSKHIGAQKKLKEIDTINQGLTIKSISIKPKTKTSKKRILKKIKRYEGKKYTFEIKDEMSDKVSEISSINGSEFKAVPVGENDVELEAEVNENNMMLLGGIGFFKLDRTYHGNYDIMGFPAIMFLDSNFFGSGNKLLVLTAAVYNMFEYTSYNIFGDKGPMVKFSGTAMFLEAGLGEYEDGKFVDDYSAKSGMYNAGISIGTESDIGYSIYLKNTVDFHKWSSSKKHSTKPSHNYTYTLSLPIVFSTIDSEMPTKLMFSEGFAIELVPALVYKYDYESWGTDNGEYWFEHNDSPQYSFMGKLSYFLTFLDRNNIGADLVYYTGSNYYKTSKWTMGPTTMLQPGPGLSGYHDGEFEFEQGALANISYSFKLIPDTLVPYAGHDAFYDIDKKEIHQGSTFGFALKLPYEIEFNTQLGIGWDAKRDKGENGYNFQASLMRVWFF